MELNWFVKSINSVSNSSNFLCALEFECFLIPDSLKLDEPFAKLVFPFWVLQILQYMIVFSFETSTSNHGYNSSHSGTMVSLLCGLCSSSELIALSLPVDSSSDIWKTSIRWAGELWTLPEKSIDEVDFSNILFFLDSNLHQWTKLFWYFVY